MTRDVELIVFAAMLAAVILAGALGWWFGHDRSDRYWLARVALIWDEGEKDGQWNEEHAVMIDAGLRKRIENPYQ